MLHLMHYPQSFGIYQGAMMLQDSLILNKFIHERTFSTPGCPMYSVKISKAMMLNINISEMPMTKFLFSNVKIGYCQMSISIVVHQC